MHDAASLGRTPTIDELSVTLGVSRKEVQAALDETVLDIVPAADQLPEACLLADEQVRHLRAAVAHLPPRMRHVIEQVFFEGRSVTDVAAALGTTHSAVSQQKSEALRLLQDGLATPSPTETPRPSPGSPASDGPSTSPPSTRPSYPCADTGAGRGRRRRSPPPSRHSRRHPEQYYPHNRTATTPGTLGIVAGQDEGLA